MASTSPLTITWYKSMSDKFSEKLAKSLEKIEESGQATRAPSLGATKGSSKSGFRGSYSREKKNKIK